MWWRPLVAVGKVAKDIITWNAVITACQKGGQWQAALLVFSEMGETKLAPDAITFGAAIAACQTGGQWEIALQILSQMSRTRFCRGLNPRKTNPCSTFRQGTPVEPWLEDLRVLGGRLAVVGHLLLLFAV